MHIENSHLLKLCHLFLNRSSLIYRLEVGTPQVHNTSRRPDSDLINFSHGRTLLFDKIFFVPKVMFWSFFIDPRDDPL